MIKETDVQTFFFFPTCSNFSQCSGCLKPVEYKPFWKWFVKVLLSPVSTPCFSADTFTNMEITVITRKVSKVTCMHLSLYLSFFMRWNMFWVLIMHRQWTHVGFAAQVELPRLRCSEVANIPTQWDLLSARFVWDPAQTMNVGIWSSPTAYGGWGVSSEKRSLSCQAVRLPFVSSPETGRFHLDCLRLCGIFLRVFENQCDRITAP